MRLYYRIRNKINHLLHGAAVIPDYAEKRRILKEYKDRYKLDILVETGTFYGETVEYFKNIFETVISIELEPNLARAAQEKFRHDNNVTIIEGDSGVVLKEIIESASHPILFWLDGHYSSEFYVGDTLVKTARTNVDTPIIDELNAILTSELAHVVLIDDARLFTGLNDYPTLSRVRSMVGKSVIERKMVVENDIIRISPRQKT